MYSTCVMNEVIMQGKGKQFNKPRATLGSYVHGIVHTYSGTFDYMQLCTHVHYYTEPLSNGHVWTRPLFLTERLSSLQR